MLVDSGRFFFVKGSLGLGVYFVICSKVSKGVKGYGVRYVFRRVSEYIWLKLENCVGKISLVLEVL